MVVQSFHLNILSDSVAVGMLPVKNDGFHAENDGFVQNMMDFILKIGVFAGGWAGGGCRAVAGREG